MEFTDLLDAYLDAKRELAEADGYAYSRRMESEVETAAARLNEFIASGGLRP